MADVVAKLVEGHELVGAARRRLPVDRHHGVVNLAANIDQSWMGVDADALFTEACRAPRHDAQRCRRGGHRRGALRGRTGRTGVVIMLTFGTGIGSGLFIDGVLVPNTELGHLELDGHDAEKRASAVVRERDGLGWNEWAPRVERYLRHVEMLFSPDLLIVGGGASKVAATVVAADLDRHRDRSCRRWPTTPASSVPRSSVPVLGTPCQLVNGHSPSGVAE